MKCHSSCSFKQWDLWHFQYQLITSKRLSVHWAYFEIRGESFPKRGSLFLRKNLIVSHVIDKELRLSRDSCWPLRGQNWTEVVLAEQGVVHIGHHFYVLSMAKIWNLWKTGGLKKAIAKLRWFELAARHPWRVLGYFFGVRSQDLWISMELRLIKQYQTIDLREAITKELRLRTPYD